MDAISGSERIEKAKVLYEESLARHWEVDAGKESFRRLLDHLEKVTDFRKYFEECLANLDLDERTFKEGLTAVDIGSGVCWASSILARHPKIKVVYAVDCSDKLLKHAEFVVGHFGVADKVKIIKGTFLEPNIPEKVDIVSLCGSFHHCHDKHIEGLFKNIKKMLKPGGNVLIANEHYVDLLWVARRMLSSLKRFRDKTRDYSFFNPLKPDRFGNHWRTRVRIENIFRKYGFNFRLFKHKDRRTLYQRIGWHYYHAILEMGTDVDMQK